MEYPIKAIIVAVVFGAISPLKHLKLPAPIMCVCVSYAQAHSPSRKSLPSAAASSEPLISECVYDGELSHLLYVSPSFNGSDERSI